VANFPVSANVSWLQSFWEIPPKGYYLPESRRGVTQISLRANISLTPGFSPVNRCSVGKPFQRFFCLSEEAVKTAHDFLPAKHPAEAGC
jgi:hypothetical protein